jgi:uncharacterized membrane protein YdbT with pleckstrin-like domain
MDPKQSSTQKTILPEPIRGSIFLLLARFFLIMAGTDVIYLSIRIYVFEMNPQWLSVNTTDISFIIFLTLSYILQIVLIYSVLLHWLNKRYYFETTHLIVRRGIFNTTERIYDLTNLKSLSVSQGLFGKLFHYGALEIVIASPSITESVYLSEVPNPRKLELQLKKFL